MIVNGGALLLAAPIENMLDHKAKAHGVSYGLSEAGYDIRIAQDVVLFPFKSFTLASAIERFQMPNWLTGIVHDKSTWARGGLSVFNTVIEPGFSGGLTIEIVYHGWKPIRIPAGAGIAQVIFHETRENASYSGKYQNQGINPQKAIFE